MGSIEMRLLSLHDNLHYSPDLGRFQMPVKRSWRRRRDDGRRILPLRTAAQLFSVVLLVSLRRTVGFATGGSQNPPRTLLPTLPSERASMVEILRLTGQRYPMDVGDEGVDRVLFCSPSAGDDSTRNGDAMSPRPDDKSRPYSGNGSLSDEEQVQRVKARALEMFGRRTTPRTSRTNASPSSKSLKATSVGERRVGSATRARQGTRAPVQIMDVLRKTARGVSSSGNAADEAQRSSDDSDDESQKSSLASRITASAVQSAIASVLRGPTSASTPFHPPFRRTSATGMEVLATAFASFESARAGAGRASASLLRPGSVILPPSEPSTDPISVYVATCHDDVNVASLRLSVFSDFTPELQSQFHSRSCQAIQSRRLRGAVCLVAKSPSGAVLGSAECSFHEFFGTRLGQRRPRNSILYVTEVAVNASVRRQGIGFKLLQALIALAKRRGVETLYLHVETTNLAALRLYAKAGYRASGSEGRDSAKDAAFTEFTRSLNLHPGATQGRDHLLLHKDLVSTPTWLSDEEQAEVKPHDERLLAPIGVLGFEIPA